MILVLILLSCTFIVTSTRLCPVSSATNFSVNGDHHYPLQIYLPHLDNSSYPFPNQVCKVKEEHKGDKNYSCPLTPQICPIIHENINESLSSSTGWKKSTSLCNVREKLKNPKEKVNVLVFGGSMPFGVSSDFCCNREECNFRGYNQNYRCAWPHYLETWLQAESRATVKVYNLARGGATSETSSEKIAEFLDTVKVNEITGNDIIFIDHSKNDNIFCNQATYATLQRGLEKLIRRILTYSSNDTNTINSVLGMPTIILMEVDTRIHKFSGIQSCYAKLYKELAQHYGLRIYSLADAVLAESSIKGQSAFHNHLTHEYRGWGHPPWHTHLMYADFVSTVLQHQFDNCDTIYKNDGVQQFVLPKALTSIDDSAQCDRKVKPYLKVSYDDIMANTTIGEYSIPVKDTWQVRLDRKGRGGIITELTNQSLFSVEHGATLNFTLNLTVREMEKLQNKAIMQLMFLKSYENSGAVIVYICGKQAHVIDSLWNDYKSYRHTTPAILTSIVNHCANWKGDQRVTIDFKHVLDMEGIRDVSKISMPTYIEKRPRTAQLFKLISIVVCKYY